MLVELLGCTILCVQERKPISEVPAISTEDGRLTACNKLLDPRAERFDRKEK